MIREVKVEDAKAIVDIYNYYIKNTVVTFEEDELSIKEMEERIIEKTKHNPWIVYEEEGRVLGYAYLSNWNPRISFRYTSEISIYFDINNLGKGRGTKLFKELIDLAQNYNIHTIVSAITMPNDVSVKLHEKVGFIQVAEFKEVGFKQNRWLDLGHFQLILNN